MSEPEKLSPAAGFPSKAKNGSTPWLHPATANELSPKLEPIRPRAVAERPSISAPKPARKRRSEHPPRAEGIPPDASEEEAALPAALEEKNETEPDEEDELDDIGNVLPPLAEPPTVCPAWNPEEGLALEARRHEHRRLKNWLTGFLMGLLAALTVGAALYFLGAFGKNALF